MYSKIVSVLLILMPLMLYAEEEVVAGVVDKVLTADIIHVMTHSGELYVRLAGIDAPDLKQPYGREAHAYLTEIVDQKPIVLRKVSTDRCGRTVAMVWVKDDEGQDVSSQMVAQGAAWVYRKYTDSGYLLGLEQIARVEKVGLWQLADDKQIAPWEYRKRMQRKGERPSDTCYIPHKRRMM